MTWAEPKNNKEEINAAGRALVKSNSADWENWNEAEWNDYYAVLDVINNWRGSHAYPLTHESVNKATHEELQD